MESRIPVFEDQFIFSCLKIIKEQQHAVGQRSDEEREAVKKRLAEVRGYYVRSQTVKQLPNEEKLQRQDGGRPGHQR